MELRLVHVGKMSHPSHLPLKYAALLFPALGFCLSSTIHLPRVTTLIHVVSVSTSVLGLPKSLALAQTCPFSCHVDALWLPQI